MKKPTDIQIAKYYGVTTATLRNYKKGSAEKQRLYAAIKQGYNPENKEQIIINKNEFIDNIREWFSELPNP